MTATRISRDAYGLKLAETAALRADCTRRQVGAVVIAPDGSIVSTGYNGLAAGLPGCASAGACPRGSLSYEEQPADVDYSATGCRAVHAEVNAILRGRGREGCAGATIYVTDEPCFHCRVVIEGAGIARLVTPSTPEFVAWTDEEVDAEVARRQAEAARRRSVPATAPSPSDAAPASTPEMDGGFVYQDTNAHGADIFVKTTFPPALSNAESATLAVPGPPHDPGAALAPDPEWLAALRRQEERVAAHRATAARRAELAERHEGWQQ